MKRLWEAFGRLDRVPNLIVFIAIVVTGFVSFWLQGLIIQGAGILDGGFLDAMLYFAGILVLGLVSTLLTLEFLGRIGAFFLDIVSGPFNEKREEEHVEAA